MLAADSNHPFPYQDKTMPQIHRGTDISVTGSITIDLKIGHNNFIVDPQVQTSLAGDVNAVSDLTWDYHPTIKGAFVLSAWKATAAGTTTLIAATAAVRCSFIAIVAASVP